MYIKEKYRMHYHFELARSHDTLYIKRRNIVLQKTSIDAVYYLISSVK